jgi:hypothetical protein
MAALAGVVAVAAAAYSTWSPCGQSMLSQLNPVAERSRGQRFRVTATWFVVGSVLGGVTLGAGMLALAAIVDAIGVSATATFGAVAVIALVCAAIDARLLPFAPPFIRRQVNEYWLPRYRGWVYGLGFGWQIGTGVTTYVMTSAVFAMVLVGGLSADPLVAFGAAILFSLVRGVAVFATDRCLTFDALAAFHRRFDAVGIVVRRAVIAALVVVATVAASLAWGWAGVAAVVVATVAATGVQTLRMRASRNAMLVAPTGTLSSPPATTSTSGPQVAAIGASASRSNP